MRNCDISLAIAISASLFIGAWDRNVLAANDCITEPKSSVRGHWYYHTDAVSHRKCWYVGRPGAQIDHAAPPQQISPKSKRDSSIVQTVVPTHLNNREQPVGVRADSQREILFQAFLRWQEQQNQPDSTPEQANRDTLFREFVLWRALHSEQ